jgi:hypothetical protein
MRRRALRPYSITLLVVNGSEGLNTRIGVVPESGRPDDSRASGIGILHPAITSGSANVTLTSAVFDAYEGATACSGALLALSNATITRRNPEPSP